MLDGPIVVEVFDLGNGWCVPVREKMKIGDTRLFPNKNDAMYAKLLKDLEGGKPLKNFRGSKYYAMYCKRLRVENPEYII